MKYSNTDKAFPVSPADWDALMADAPETVDDPECAYNPNDAQAVGEFWKDGFVSHSYTELQEQIAKRRGRGKQKSPTKVSTTLRLSPDVMAYFKATGDGWQTRVDAVLREYIQSHPA